MMKKKKTFKRIGKEKKNLPKSVEMTFEVGGHHEDYTAFINKLCEKLGNHNDPDSMSAFEATNWKKPDHILLPKQTAPEPARWMVIKLSAKEHKTTLYVRDDNVYLVGFENKKGQKYQAGRGCGGQSSRPPKNNEKAPDQILEDAIPLGYDLSYDDLGNDRLKWNLQQISAKDAVIKLSTYGTKETKQECIKKYMARLILIICEAARMYRIMTRVREGWSSNGGAFLTVIERETLNEWVHISQAMMRWGTYTPGLKKIQVENHEQAGRVVHLIKYAPMGITPNASSGGDDPSDTSPGGGNGHGTSPGGGNGHAASPGGGSGDGRSPGGGSGDRPPANRNGKNWQQAAEGNGKSQQQQGRSLVEVSSIRPTEGCTLPDVGSITVFDGKRGQIIYWNKEDGDAPRVDSKGDLVLTGPYRAISAGGRVALRITSVSDSHTAEDDLLIWDPYTEDAHEEIDGLISGDIAKDLTLTYAVLSSAVEATVQVNVFLVRQTDFYGEITARSKLKNDEEISVVLFSRKIKDKVELEPSSAGSTIPLTRSVLAWPVGSTLLIKVEGFHSRNLLHNGLHLRTNVERSFQDLGFGFSFGDHTDKVCSANIQCFGYIRLSVDDTGEYREKPNNISLPRSFDQLSRGHTLAAERELSLAAEQNDIMRMGILEREPGEQDFMDPEDIGTRRPKLLVVRTSPLRFIRFKRKKFFTCLLHLTNDSDDQPVAFRCRSVFELDRRLLGSLLAHSSARKWELSGIVRPNSTSTYLVRCESKQPQLRATDTVYLILESCAASHDEKHLMDTIFDAASVATEKVLDNETTTSEQGEGDVGLDIIFRAAEERIEKVKLTLGDPADRSNIYEETESDDLDTLFSRPSKGIKEVTIKGTVNHPADMPMTSESDLDVYPLQLHFPFKQDKVICCPLRLTNRTDYYVIFECLAHTSYGYFLYTLDHLNGILPPRSTCTYVVAMGKQKDLPDNVDALSVILKSCTAEKITGPDKYISRQDPMHERIPPRIEIITALTGYVNSIQSMDVHPTEPWILTSHFNGNVSIWNYQTQARVMEFRKSDIGGGKISSTKFIARQKWIVAGGEHGFIYVVTYTTNKKVSEFQVHNEWVESLAVHPNQPIVLSASYDGMIMLWNWDVNRDPIWQRTRTFSGHTAVVCHVTFNPYDNGNTFASASHDDTVKIWRTNDPNDQPKPIATLDCGQDAQRNVAYFSMGGRQYMITGSLKGAARVWDLKETNRPIKELDGPESLVFGCNVGVVTCVSDNTNPVLITVSGDKGISFLDATTYKPRYGNVNFGLGEALGFASIEVKGKRSLAITFAFGIAIMEMNEDPVDSPAILEQAQEGIYSAQSSKEQ